MFQSTEANSQGRLQKTAGWLWKTSLRWASPWGEIHVREEASPDYLALKPGLCQPSSSLQVTQLWNLCGTTSVCFLSPILIDYYEMRLRHLELHNKNTVALNILTDNKIILISYCYGSTAQHMAFYLHKNTHKDSDTWDGACIIRTFINMTLWWLSVTASWIEFFIEGERERSCIIFSGLSHCILHMLLNKKVL